MSKNRRLSKNLVWKYKLAFWRNLYEEVQWKSFLTKNRPSLNGLMKLQSEWKRQNPNKAQTFSFVLSSQLRRRRLESEQKFGRQCIYVSLSHVLSWSHLKTRNYQIDPHLLLGILAHCAESLLSSQYLCQDFPLCLSMEALENGSNMKLPHFACPTRIVCMSGIPLKLEWKTVCCRSTPGVVLLQTQID